MGGINHQPSNKISEGYTVPASEALSQIGIYMLTGNVWIERAIMSAREVSYGASRAHLGGSVVSFSAAVTQVDVFSGYIRQILGVLNAGDYEPFVPTSRLDLDVFYAQFVEAGLVPDSAAARSEIEALRAGSYTAAFESYLAQAESLSDSLTVLCDLTITMRDGREGYQGLFWHTVETNTKPWRQAFSLALTGYTNLLAAFQTGALVSTETFLLGTEAPGLLSNLHEVSTVRNTVVATA